MEYLVKIDATQQSFEAVDSIPNLTWIYTYVHALDDQNLRYFFVQNAPARLITLSITTGEILNIADCPTVQGFFTMHSCHYNPVDNKLYGIHADNFTGLYFFARVDPDDCTVEQLGDFFPPGYQFDYELDTFSITDEIYYVVDYDNMYILRSFDPSNGDVLDEQIISTGANESVYGVTMDDSSNEIYMILFNYINDEARIAKLDVTNGSLNQVGSTFPLSGQIFSPSSSIDSENEIFYLQGGEDFYGYFVQGINMVTSEEEYYVELIPPSDFPFGSNVLHGEYSNTLHELFAMHWGPVGLPIGVSDVSSQSFRFNVFPNPSHGNLQIRLSEPMKNASLKLYDSKARLIGQWATSNETTIQLDSELPPGMYIFHLTSNDQVPIIEKVIID